MEKKQKLSLYQILIHIIAALVSIRFPLPDIQHKEPDTALKKQRYLLFHLTVIFLIVLV